MGLVSSFFLAENLFTEGNLRTALGASFMSRRIRFSQRYLVLTTT